MTEQEAIAVDPQVIKRLEKAIVVAENGNIKTRKRNDVQMVKYIIDKIEEEVKC